MLWSVGGVMPSILAAGTVAVLNVCEDVFAHPTPRGRPGETLPLPGHVCLVGEAAPCCDQSQAVTVCDQGGGAFEPHDARNGLRRQADHRAELLLEVPSGPADVCGELMHPARPAGGGQLGPGPFHLRSY